MALPEDIPSSIAVGGLYLSPDDQLTTALVDYEQAGVDFNDPSGGLQFQTWRAWWDYTDGWVYVQSAIGEPVQVQKIPIGKLQGFAAQVAAPGLA